MLMLMTLLISANRALRVCFGYAFQPVHRHLNPGEEDCERQLAAVSSSCAASSELRSIAFFRGPG